NSKAGGAPAAEKPVAKKSAEKVTPAKKAPASKASVKKVAAPKVTPAKKVVAPKKAAPSSKAAPKASAKSAPATAAASKPVAEKSTSRGGKSLNKNLAMHQRIIQHSLEMANLKPNQCRWPIGDPDSEDFHFCGDTVFVGKPYCYEHCKQAYQFTPPKKK
ncbi:MAG: hypothetical protein K2L94_02650, partial [Alphaproteobacteria bacterium]|nr:hypothetical protein [Alphaproteobacteria bacterium]